MGLIPLESILYMLGTNWRFFPSHTRRMFLQLSDAEYLFIILTHYLPSKNVNIAQTVSSKTLSNMNYHIETYK